MTVSIQRYDVIDITKNPDGTDISIDAKKMVRQPRIRSIGWTISEFIGVGYINPRGISNIKKTSI